MTDAARKYVAEFIGTFILVLIGTSALVASGGDIVATSLGFGLGLLAAFYAVGEISGGHFNPAISLAALIDKRIDLSHFIGYVIAQVAGGVVAGAGLWWATNQDAVASSITTTPESIGGGSGFITEIYLTGIFVLVYLAVTKSREYGRQAFLAIAFAYAAVHFAGLELSGASVNPARSLGPAIAGNSYTDLWIYVTAPFVGAIVAWVIHQFATTGKVEAPDIGAMLE